jgi:hypothetical protein
MFSVAITSGPVEIFKGSRTRVVDALPGRTSTVSC